MTNLQHSEIPHDVIVIEGHKVSCDGGGGALGHPVVWYDLVEDDVVQCKYCDKRFIRKGSPMDPST